MPPFLPLTVVKIGCFILMSTLKLVVTIGLEAIPGVGQAVTSGMGMAIDAAKTIGYFYPEAEDPVGAFDFWLSPCGGSDLVPEELKAGYDILSSVAEGVTGWRTPPKLTKGGGKKGDAGNPDRGKPLEGTNTSWLSTASQSPTRP
jgi:hypothetical protein